MLDDAALRAPDEPLALRPPAGPAAAPAALRLRLLGGFRVEVGDRVVAAGDWRLQKAAALVKLLALAPGHRLHREQVQEWLWPDLAPDAAYNNLRYALHVARRALATPGAPSADPLALRRDVVSLGSAGGLWTDVAAFESAAAAARRAREPAAYRAALALYADDLLPDDPYEDWAAGRREA